MPTRSLKPTGEPLLFYLFPIIPYDAPVLLPYLPPRLVLLLS